MSESAAARTRQELIEFRTQRRGLLEITDKAARLVADSGIESGLLSVFCRHTSCSLILMENADPTARRDLEDYFERIAPDGDPRYAHCAEGPDDMSAHLRMVLTQSSITIPVAKGRLMLGTWQGLFLWEHRTTPHRREIILTVSGY